MILYLNNFPQNKHMLDLSLKKVKQETTAPRDNFISQNTVAW